MPRLAKYAAATPTSEPIRRGCWFMAPYGTSGCLEKQRVADRHARVREVPAEAGRLPEGGAEAMNPFQERAKRPGSALAGPYGHPCHAMVVPVPLGACIATLALDVASRNAEDGAGYAWAATVTLGVGLAGA